VQVSGKDFQDGEVELDFIKSQIGESKTLKLSDVEPDENYKIRAQFVAECMDKYYNVLKKFKPKEKD
jgi:hypothetical protein